MSGLEIIQLPKDQWKDYKNLRLKSLTEDPEAFGQTLEDALNLADKKWKQKLAKAAKGKDHWMNFARLNGKLVGMVSARETNPPDLKPTVKIQEMFVVKEFRNKGIGRKLILALLDEVCKNPKWQKARLNVFSSQKTALKFYKALGFEMIGKKLENFSDGRIKETFLLEKLLK